MKLYNESKKINSKSYSDFKKESYNLNKTENNSRKLNNNYYTYHNNNKSNISNFNNSKKDDESKNNSLNTSQSNNTSYTKNKFSNNNNPGVRIYNKHIEHMKKKEEKLKIMKDKEEELKKKELKSLKFRPVINNYSRVSNFNYNPGKIEDKLIAYGKKYKQNINLMKKQISDENSHKPQLTKETEILGKKKRNIREENLPNHTLLINPDYLIGPVKPSKTNDLSFSFNKNKNMLKNAKKSKSFDDINKRKYKTYYNPLHPITRKTTKFTGKKIPLPKLTPDNNLYDYLYIESKLLKEKRDIDIMKDMAKRCPFKPDLSKTKNKNKKQNYKSKNNVFDRLFMAQNYKKKIVKTPENKKPRNSILRDSKTGQLLFKPIISRGPLNRNQRNLKDLSLEKDLNYTNKKNKELENQQREEIKKEYLGKTKKLILEAKKLKYIELFKSLDSDNDGFISNKKIKLSVLDNKKLVALTPIFQELQYGGVARMDLKQFCQKVDEIQEFKNIANSELEISDG